MLLALFGAGSHYQVMISFDVYLIFLAKLILSQSALACTDNEVVFPIELCTLLCLYFLYTFSFLFQYLFIVEVTLGMNEPLPTFCYELWAGWGCTPF